MKICIGTGYEVNIILVDERILDALCHTPYHAHDEPAALLALENRELLKAREDFLLGIVAYRAGVEKHCVGGFYRFRYSIASHLHYRGYNLAVGNIHLASVGLDEQMLVKLFVGHCQRCNIYFFHIFHFRFGVQSYKKRQIYATRHILFA